MKHITRTLIYTLIVVILYFVLAISIVIVKPKSLITDLDYSEWAGNNWYSRHYKFDCIDSLMTPYGYVDAFLFGNKSYVSGEYTYLSRDDHYNWYEFKKNGLTIRFTESSEFISNVIDQFHHGQKVQLTIVNYLHHDHNLRYSVISSISSINSKTGH